MGDPFNYSRLLRGRTSKARGGWEDDCFFFSGKPQPYILIINMHQSWDGGRWQRRILEHVHAVHVEGWLDRLVFSARHEKAL